MDTDNDGSPCCVCPRQKEKLSKLRKRRDVVDHGNRGPDGTFTLLLLAYYYDNDVM